MHLAGWMFVAIRPQDRAGKQRDICQWYAFSEKSSATDPSFSSVSWLRITSQKAYIYIYYYYNIDRLLYITIYHDHALYIQCFEFISSG